MHGTSIFSNPVYISLYFPHSSNRDISMLFLALSYSYSEQCWSYINNACPFLYDAVSLQLLPFVITPPLPKTGKHNWFLARSDDGKRLMIIRTHEPEKLYCKNPTVYKHCVICEYLDSGCYVYEQDTRLLGPLGFFSWRRVNSLGSHSLFLGLNYPINQEITVGKDLDGTEALFAMENCVYTASPRTWEETPLTVNDTACSQKKVRMTKASGLTLILECLKSDRQWCGSSLQVDR